MSDAKPKLYAKRNVIALGEHYTRHVSAMTGEGLHDKSSIAAELAWRDRRIAQLEADNEGLRRWRAAIEHPITESGDVARGYIEATERTLQLYWRDFYDARRQIHELKSGMREAITGIEEWGAYADEYFQRKHDLAGDVARLRAVLNREE